MPTDDSPSETRELLDQEAVAWHVRLHSGEADAGVRAAFETWRESSPAHADAYRRVERLWRRLDAPLRNDHRRRRTAHRTRFIPAWAAACALLLAFAWRIFPDYLAEPWADYRTRIGEQKTIRLADGSRVYLNTDSALDVELGEHERRIHLRRGEAAFEVAHERSRPLRVTAGATVTEALGTRFVVRFDNPAGSITLLQGKVRAERLASTGLRAEAVELRPGERTVFDGQRLAPPQPADAAGDAWRRGRLVFNFVPLKRVVAELNRYRRGRIEVLDDALAEHEVNAAIDLAHIDAWLDALPASLPAHVRRIGPWTAIGP